MHVQVHQGHRARGALLQRPGHVLREGAGPRAALRAQESQDLALARQTLLVAGEDPGQLGDEVGGTGWEQDVLRNAAFQEALVERDAVDSASHNDGRVR